MSNIKLELEPDTADKVIGYLMDDVVYARLRGVEKALYGDGSLLTPDRRRDLANSLNLALSQLVPVNENGRQANAKS